MKAATLAKSCLFHGGARLLRKLISQEGQRDKRTIGLLQRHLVMDTDRLCRLSKSSVCCTAYQQTGDTFKDQLTRNLNSLLLPIHSIDFRTE